MMIINDKAFQAERLTIGEWLTNAYIVTCKTSNHAIMIDAPADADLLYRYFNNSILDYILLTHGHPDHTGALPALLTRTKGIIAVHPEDAVSLPVTPQSFLEDNREITFGAVTLKVIHTPGHTPGSLCFKIGKYLFSGDTIFPGGPGNTRSPLAFNQIIESIKTKIMPLSDETLIYPGHGESTTLKSERDKFEKFASRPQPQDLCGDVLW